jgi:hypothetical protein
VKRFQTKGVNAMLWTIVAILIFLWLLGMVGGIAMGSWMHVFLVLAVILVLANIALRSRSA